MIFLTVGTQLPFDRLIAAVDTWLDGRNLECFAQTCGGEVVPRNMKSKPYLDPDEFDSYFRRAELVVAHAGMGSILSALSSGKPLLIVPRRAALGEHRNDHQMATAKRFEPVDGVRVVFDEKALPDAMRDLLSGETSERAAPISPHAPERFLEEIRRLINA